MCRFRILRHLVFENGTQFAIKKLGKLCTKLRIKKVFASVEHPKTNGQAESVNRVLLRGLKKRLEKERGNCSKEILRLLWSYHTTP